MTTVAKQVVSIQDLVSELRQFPQSAFEETEPIRKFLRDRPVDAAVVYSAEQGICGEIQLHYNTAYGKSVSR